jgi:ribosomal protein S18 acetylase RimI-like enzyme
MEDLVVSKLGDGDRTAWQELFQGYLSFYETSLDAAGYDRTWEAFQRDETTHALGARAGGELVGIVHFLEHASTTAADVCYLQDLFTTPEARGRGVGRALIAGAVEAAKARGCSRVYWVTHETNSVARALYDRVALNSGFIRYQIAL